MVQSLPQITVRVAHVQHSLDHWLHPELVQVLDDLKQFLLPLSLLVVGAQSDVLRPVLRKNLHLQQRGLCVTDCRLVARLIVHRLLLSEERFSHPLHVFGKVRFQGVLLFYKGKRVEQCDVISINHRPADTADHQK